MRTCGDRGRIWRYFKGEVLGEQMTVGREIAWGVALGLYRTPEHEKGPLEGLRWGLCHAFGQDGWLYIRRYEVDERLKRRIMGKEMYE